MVVYLHRPYRAPLFTKFPILGLSRPRLFHIAPSGFWTLLQPASRGSILLFVERGTWNALAEDQRRLKGSLDSFEKLVGVQIPHHTGGLNLISLRIDEDYSGHSIHLEPPSQQFCLG